MTKDNVIELRQEDLQIWICNCGCATAYLLEDGSAKCTVCSEVHTVEKGGWGYFDKGKRSQVDSPIIDVNGNGSVEFARRRIAAIAQDEDVVALVVVKECSRVSTWTKAETSEQLSWVLEGVEDAKNLISTVSANGKDSGR